MGWAWEGLRERISDSLCTEHGSLEPNAGPKWLLENVTAEMANRKSRVLCRRAEATVQATTLIQGHW